MAQHDRDDPSTMAAGGEPTARDSRTPWPAVSARVAFALLQPPFAWAAFACLACVAWAWTFMHSQWLNTLLSAAACLGGMCFALGGKKRFAPRTRVAGARWVCPVAVAALMAAGGLRDAARVTVDHTPRYDQGEYLDAAAAARPLGWPAPGAVVGSMFRGQCLMDNQHPLYVWVLTAVMRNEVRSY